MLANCNGLAVGYSDASQCFVVRNSWGARWGKNGYCLMPYAYLADPDLAADFWTIRMVEADESELCASSVHCSG